MRTKSPMLIFSFCASPAFISNTALTFCRERVGLSDCVSRRVTISPIMPPGKMKIISSGINVLRIQNCAMRGGCMGNTMPCCGAISLTNIKPRRCFSAVSATATSKTNSRPSNVATLSGAAAAGSTRKNSSRNRFIISAACHPRRSRSKHAASCLRSFLMRQSRYSDSQSGQKTGRFS